MMSDSANGPAGGAAAHDARRSRDILSVAQLNDAARALLEAKLGFVWVQGEISNLARPRSGHLYFTLKDDNAQIRCAMFRNRNVALAFRPEDGLGVLAYGRVSLYMPRGDYQLIVEALEPAGEGMLRLRFEQLKRKLHAAGLFDEARKRPLPAWPGCIGIVTSASGAAVRDVLTVLRRRCPSIPVIVYPTVVQGADAAASIAAAIASANRRAECDVLIVGRGGGSLEDLWAFNEETVARAIHDSAIPVVSAVGHEVDFTIADMVADLRAATPSAAAELVSPDLVAVRDYLDTTARRLRGGMLDRIGRARERVAQYRARLVSPRRRLDQHYQRIDELAQRLAGATVRHVQLQRSRLEALATRALARTPSTRIRHGATELAFLGARLERAVDVATRERHERLERLSGMLQAVGPTATLERGYAIVTDAAGDIVRYAAALQRGDVVTTRVARGSFSGTVESTDEQEPGRR